ncbi:MAG: class B sortase [Anaerovoracaceae bacterium]
MGKIRKGIFVIALIVFLGSLGVLVTHFIKGYLEERDFHDLGKLMSEQKDLVTEKGTVVGKYVDLYKANPDIIGWVKIKGTKIDYPVMQTQDDPEYYLRRNFAKEDKVSGVPFMDAASDIFKPTSNFMIYGHNMNNGTMFHGLLDYAKKDFYLEHKTIKFDTIYKGGQGKYKIIAAFYTQIYDKEKEIFKYYQYPGIEDKAAFVEYVEGVKGLSQYDTGINAKYGDQLITLSTCSYHVEDKKGRFAVVAKRVE